jgi:hypothetical protein
LVIGVGGTPREQRDIHDLMIDRIDQRCDPVNSFAARPRDPSDKESLLYCSGSLAAGPRHRPGAADYAAPRTHDRAASWKPCDTISLTRTPPQFL